MGGAMSLWERGDYQARRKRHHWLPDSKDKAFKAHAAAIGQLAIQWNLLHEAMGFLFLALMKGEHSNQYAEVWSAVASDRAKRDMLLAAADGMWIHPDAKEERQRHEFVRGLVKKLVGAASGLEDARNNAVHAPLAVAVNALRADFGTVFPDISLSNARAKRLQNKDLLTEFRWCRDYAYALGLFARALHETLSSPGKRWPELPRPPYRGDKRTRDASHGKRATKVRTKRAGASKA
jgi:hypothetical protein